MCVRSGLIAFAFAVGLALSGSVVAGETEPISMEVAPPTEPNTVVAIADTEENLEQVDEQAIESSCNGFGKTMNVIENVVRALDPTLWIALGILKVTEPAHGVATPNTVLVDKCPPVRRGGTP